jgi:prepilin-type N-terminal cleavage/methylation domain-containing protein
MIRSALRRDVRAFTLIELLIVVAIIAILAAIAVPNFLEAQTRAKISRGKADMKSLITAMESYGVDNNKYIEGVTNSDLIDHGNAAGGPGPAYSVLRLLSTPVSYISSLPFKAPFDVYDGFSAPGFPKEQGYQYIGGRTEWEATRRNNDCMPTGPWYPESYRNVSYYFNCVGPTKVYTAKRNQSSSVHPRIVPYDPTNGTVSTGDIIAPQGGHGGWTSLK